ncbi:ninein-like protein isoform X2 [Hydra vulgaris]|uniref:ninein-like protein isoform X2 n=1 Tax=Hydra vulgaris TaxID=6087 RepID=UPI001F5F256E|nr:ninein-like protein isoform X2 [Hydra vulgaris]
MDNDEDVYVYQLKELFESCDLQSKGYLNRNELIDLAQKLQLNDQIPALLVEVLGDAFNEGEVSFEKFRDGFVNVLAQGINVYNDLTEDECSELEAGDSEREISFQENNKSLKNEKPLKFQDSNVFSQKKNNVQDKVSPRNAKPRKTSTPFRDGKKNSVSGLSAKTLVFPIINDDDQYRKSETSIDIEAILGSDVDLNAEELWRIWQDVAVGESGYINLHQLSTVCDSIGMEGLDNNELELLFAELDVNGDGLVSFNEFLSGLLVSKSNCNSHRSPISSRSQSFSLTPKSNHGLSKRDSESKISVLSERNVEILSTSPNIDKEEEFLFKSVSKKKNQWLNQEKEVQKYQDFALLFDPEDTGFVNFIDVKNYLIKNNIKDVSNMMKELSPDTNGKIRIKKVLGLFESLVFERDDDLTNSLLQIYRRKIKNLQGQLDASSADLGVLKDQLMKLETATAEKLRDGEHHVRLTEQRNEEKLKLQAQLFSERVMSKERELNNEHNFILSKNQKEIRALNEKIEELKREDAQTKNKLQDAKAEISHLEKSLTEKINELAEERNKYLRLEEKLETYRSFKHKITGMEKELNAANEKKTQQSNRIFELESINKGLRDRIDEYVAKIERLSNRSSKSENSLSRSGSLLSNYVKPLVRRSGSETYEDGFDTTANAKNEIDELQNIIASQESVITSLKRELETVNKHYEEMRSLSSDRSSVDRIADKCATQLSNMERIMVTERDELSMTYSKEKKDLVDYYEKKLDILRQQLSTEKNKEGSDLIKGAIDCASEFSDREQSFQKEYRKLVNTFREEKEELEMNYRSKITKLEEKVVILETENAEMELKFLNEKAELEQKFRIERAELQMNATSTSREYDRSQKYIDFLKDDLNKKNAFELKETERRLKKEKNDLIEKMENEILELNKKHQREISDLRKTFNQKLTDTEKSFGNERACIKESFAREKTEMEQKFVREKNELRDMLKQEYDHALALQNANERRISVEERTQIEEQLNNEKFELLKALQHEKSNAEAQIRQLRTSLESKFAEEKSRMNEDFQKELARLDNRNKREISDLQQAFTGGEVGIKEKMKDEFSQMITKYKTEWELSYQREKEELIKSFSREKSELEANWTFEKLRLEESFASEKTEMMNMHQIEKDELLKKFYRQKQNMEIEFKERYDKLSEDIDNEILSRIDRETKFSQMTIEHLKKELSTLKEQKKELETKNQVLELKSLSQQQEAAEIKVFQEQKSSINEKISNYIDEIEALKKERESSQKNLRELAREKTLILDNSVQEITEQQEKIARLQNEKEKMQEKIEQLLIIENQAEELKKKNSRLGKEISEKDKCIESLKEVENESNMLKKTLTNLDSKIRELEYIIQEKHIKISRLEEEIAHLQDKIIHMESVHGKELSAQKERMEMLSTAAATEKSRYFRELNDLRDQLSVASASSDRDSALKDKVFHDAKAEVINLNKKIEEKTRRNRYLEEALKAAEDKLVETTKQKNEFDCELRQLRQMMNESGKGSEERAIETKSLRSDTLVNELYLENAELMKQLANAESNQYKAEKEARQLSDQKRALQRVISKLCGANGISNLT